MECFDFGIIGGGPAGYTAGMELAKQGHSVILFEKDKIGGTCLNRGCIPTKNFLHYAEIFSNMKKYSDLGIAINNIDLSNIVDRKNKTVEKVRKALELAVKNSGVKIIYTEAAIKNEHIICTENEEYSVNQIILATGAKPREIKGMEFDHKFILSSDDILNLSTLPKSLLIVGSGAIGIEWARIFSSFGVEVSIVEMAEHLIPTADIEVSKRIERIFKQKGIKYYLSDCIDKIENQKAILKSGKEIMPDNILVAVGRIPISDSNYNIIKLGDACGEIQLAHYAIHQAQEFATGIPFNKKLVPAVIYGEPEIAWIGLREQDVDETYSKKMLPITALGKAWCDDATDGFIKLIIKNDIICGAHIVSKEASSLIHILLLAIQNKITIQNLKEFCFAHPTYAEGIFEAIK